MCSWDNPKLKTNSQLPIRNPETKGIFFRGFVWERKRRGKKKQKKKNKTKQNTHCWLLIVEECLSKLWSYQAQNAAREGGTCARERDFLAGEGVGSENGGKRAFAYCCCYSSPCSSLAPSRLPSLLSAEAIFHKPGRLTLLLFVGSVCLCVCVCCERKLCARP